LPRLDAEPHGSLFTASTKSLWSENVPENQGVRPIFQIPIFKTTFASSSPVTPAR
jgi:hypothetical protein